MKNCVEYEEIEEKRQKHIENGQKSCEKQVEIERNRWKEKKIETNGKEVECECDTTVTEW